MEYQCLLYDVSEGIATLMPAAVVIRASEMPPASWFGSPVPSRRMTLKTSIMPMTVPRRPSRGAIPATVPSAVR